MSIPNHLCEPLGLVVDTHSIERVHSLVQTIDLSQSMMIGGYGSIQVPTEDIGHDHNEAVAGASIKIGNLVGAMDAADPRLILKSGDKASFWARFTGKQAVRKMEYVQTTELLTQQLSEVPAIMEAIQLSIGKLSSYGEELARTQFELKCHVVAGRWYLENNPEAGIAGETLYGIETPRARFSKRLDQLVVLITSNETTAHQLKLMRANSISLLDRLHEITNVLIPVWRSRRMALYVNNQDYGLIKAATEAHDALVGSLKSI